jgi:hypothetical protein
MEQSLTKMPRTNRTAGVRGGAGTRKETEMGFLDKAKGAAQKAVDEHGDKVESGKQKAEDALYNLDGKNDDIR